MSRSFIVLLVFALLGAVSLSAQGIDFSLDSSALMSVAPKLSTQVSQAAAITGILPLGSSLRLTTRIGISVAYTYDKASNTSVFSYPDALADIDIPEMSLAFAGPVKGETTKNLSFALGRVPFVDSTGSIYSYRMDGMILSATYPLGTIRTVLGYTGFLPSSAPIINSTADTLHQSEYGLAPPRALASFSFRTPRIAGHDAYLAFTAQEDLRNETQFVPEYQEEKDSDSSGGPADSSYLSAGITGSPIAALSYSGYGIFQFGRRLSYTGNEEVGYVYLYMPVRAWSFGAQARYSLTPSLVCSLRAVYGSGDTDASRAVDGNTEGDATQFTPITSGSSAMIFSATPGNLTQLEFGVNYRPFPTKRLGLMALQTSSKTFIFVKNGIGPVSEPGVSSESKMSLLGIEEDLSASTKILSDTTLSASAGVFLPMKGAYTNSYYKKAPVQFTVRAGLSLAL